MRDIVDAAAADGGLAREDVLRLLALDAASEDAAYVRARAHEVALRAAGGRGLVHAQIGVDEHPCPENCRFCLFAACNGGRGGQEGKAGSGRRGNGAPSREADGRASGQEGPRSYEVPLDGIVAAARTFDTAGVHLISLMATAGLPFDRLGQMVAAVREAVSPDMPILVNAADMTPGQARALKDAGATAAYHARRIQEGVITDIAPERRLATIRAIHQAGLALMTGVEPLWEGVGPDELADRIAEIPSFEPYCTGVCALTLAAGTQMEHVRPAAPERVRLVAAIVRLAVGEAVPIGGTGGAVWVDAGTDPRGRGYSDDGSTLLRKVAQAKEKLAGRGWAVPDRPPHDVFAR